MPGQLAPLLARRPDLLLRPIGDKGQYVVKDPRAGTYFQVGEEEYFLLSQLDGKQDEEAIQRAFEKKFQQPLSAEDLSGFVEMAQAQGFLQAPGDAEKPSSDSPEEPDRQPTHSFRNWIRQSPLYWRTSLLDPDRFLTWLAPRIAFVWTRLFFLVSAGAIVAAALVVWLNRREMWNCFALGSRWETLVLAWLVLVLATACHEFAHGLTCKHYGGEVHEVGFILIMLMPAFYCNVSDAWLFREKSKRLLVMLAGGYCDLCLWAIMVGIWRLTMPNSLINYLCWVVLSVLGARIFFNFNPLLRLDGYYLFSDWTEVPNLRKRSWEYVAVRLRWILWGADRPVREARGNLLLGYGLLSWSFSVTFLVLGLLAYMRFFGYRWGLFGAGLAIALAFALLPRLFRGLSKGEVSKMFLLRHKRTLFWMLVLAAIPVALWWVHMEERSSGPFQVRPATRAEVRATVAGFLRNITFEEGDRVSPGAVLAVLEVPDLPSRVAQKSAEVREVQAKLRLLEEGVRPEEIMEQRYRVERAKAWRDLAEQHLTRSREAFQADLQRLDKSIAQCEAELAYANSVLARSQGLHDKGITPEQEHQEVKKKHQVTQAQLELAQAQKTARQAQGTLDAETELARREKEFADARATLSLLEAGSRPQEVEAERARLARAREELKYLEEQQARVKVTSPVGGFLSTPHFKERAGQYVREGDLICLVEEPETLEAEIALSEQDVARVQPGQLVDLKARALPFRTFPARVVRIAPFAGHADKLEETKGIVPGELPGTVTVYVQFEDRDSALRPGMTGFARIYCGPQTAGEILLDRALRLLRTEFWW